MTARIRVVALGALVAVVLALAMLASAPQAQAIEQVQGSINGIRKEHMLRPICMPKHNVALLRVVNPYHHRSTMEIYDVDGSQKKFQLRAYSYRYVRVRMHFSPRAADALLEINGRPIDTDNVPKKQCH